MFFVLLVAALGGVYWYKYKRQPTGAQFRSLDLVENESLMDEEDDSNSRFTSLKSKLQFDD
jgi:hypothetical protein